MGQAILTIMSLIVGGYLVFGRIHMLDLRFGRPTHPTTKVFCPDPSIDHFFCQFFAHEPIYLPKYAAQSGISTIFANFCSWTHLSTKILSSNPSICQNFTLFVGKWPTHPSTSSIRIHENMWILPGVKYSWNCSSWSGECISCKIVIFVTKMCSNFSHVLTIISLVTIFSNCNFGPLYVLPYSMIHL